LLLLIIWPLYLLWGVDLPRKEKRIILILFGSTIFMAPFVAVHAAYMYHFDDPVEGAVLVLTAHAEVSPFVCELVGMALIHYLARSFSHNM
jgi:hypothetical protein